MNAGWAIAGCLAIGGVAAVWPYGSGRRRLGRRQGTDRLDPGRLRGVPWPWTSPDLAGIRAGLGSAAVRHPRRLIAGSLALAAIAGLVAAGPIAAVLAGVYCALAIRAATRQITTRRTAADRARSLDGLGSLAADLRAGLPPAMAEVPLRSAGTEALAADQPSAGNRSRRMSSGHGVGGQTADTGDRAGRMTDLTAAVWRLAEQTGAPAADLVERIEADARAADRARASASAQAAGAKATALLLAALPVGGIALGYAIGADPLRVLLHTPVGGACAVASAFLQCAGLLWSERLTSGPAR